MGRTSPRRPTPAPGPPVYAGDFPDPCLIPVAGGWFAYATQAGGRNVPVLRSDDLRRWEPVGDALPVLPAWARPGRTWSPAVLPRGDGYVLYPVLWEPRSGRQAIGLLTGPSPLGPFVDRAGGPFVHQVYRGGSIDPSPFVDDDGAAYLYWKSDDNALRRPPSLWGQRLTDDGLALVGEPTQLLRQDRGWEDPLIEAPAVVRAGDTYYLFYSANWWESERYCVGYATSPAPLGPYRRVTKHGPWMASGPDALGPGGQEFFVDAGGSLRMAFHAWAPGRVGYANGGRRALHLARVAFVDGAPVVQP
ncbi:MAG TPA: glycoside hydrolase family 43 protein [Acidimicrobiales bacterium]|nr:glycoside hydrolase family 43 protein [Acidimicrobiales bacterium]